MTVVASITKYAVCIIDPLKSSTSLKKQCILMKHGRRGPVWIDIPLDVQASEIDLTQLEAFASADPSELALNSPP